VQPSEADNDRLLDEAAAGDDRARDRLLERYRQRLRELVALRMDRRLAARVDPSDVVQESLLEADQRLAEFVRDRPMPFYLWLRQLTLDRLIDLYRHHHSQKRSVRREARALSPLPEGSLHELVDRLVSKGSSPSAGLHREDRRRQAQSLLGQLPDADRELLVLRHLEHLSMKEVAAVLGISEGAAKVRHVRALARLREILGPVGEE
jgi:RNA polymerase sigma-70 factor (ECF subfamily)